MNNTYSLKVKNLTELVDDHHFLLSQYYNNKTFTLFGMSAVGPLWLAAAVLLILSDPALALAQSTRALRPVDAVCRQSACPWPSQPGWRQAPAPSHHSVRGKAGRNSAAAPMGALDASSRAWSEGPEARDCRSTRRRMRAAKAARQATGID